MYNIDLLNDDDNNRIANVPKLEEEMKKETKKKEYRTLAEIHEAALTAEKVPARILLMTSPKSKLAKRIAEAIGLKVEDPKRFLAERIVDALKRDISKDKTIKSHLGMGGLGGQGILVEDWPKYHAAFAKWWVKR